MTQRQAVNNDDRDGAKHRGERTYYVYDISGQRVVKATEAFAGVLVKQRIYLGGFEIYREYNSGANTALERQTLHIMDDKQRVALVEMRTQGNDGTPAQLIRCQFGNHLGSSYLELDDQAQVISYEEYYPYGSTSYQAVRSDLETSRKRYRYTGKERDEETGFYYHGARYYAAWIGRWISCDPIGLAADINLFRYNFNRPITFIDPDGRQGLGIVPPTIPDPSASFHHRAATCSCASGPGCDTSNSPSVSPSVSLGGTGCLDWCRCNRRGSTCFLGRYAHAKQRLLRLFGEIQGSRYWPGDKIP
jgi:RHS repeat-associated protein